jgi:hypothetical protein
MGDQLAQPRAVRGQISLLVLRVKDRIQPAINFYAREFRLQLAPADRSIVGPERRKKRS